MALPFDKDLVGIKVYLKVGATDFRRGIKGLISLVEGSLKIQMDEKSIFVFCSKNKKQIKMIYIEGAGAFLIQRKIKYGFFPWPQTNEEALLIDMDDLRVLIADPISIESLRARRLVQKIQLHL
jgi:transposase